jgi:DNA-3-methyladenine glycosylase II
MLPTVDYTPAIAALCHADPILQALIQHAGECTLHQQQQTGELFPSLAKAIIYQQLSGKAAATIHQRFLALYPGVEFPTAQDILSTDDELLRGAGLSRAKVIYVKDLARHVELGLPAIDDLHTLSDNEIIQLLTRVKGIGRWSVQMLLIFRLHRWDVLPVDDLGIRAGAKRLYQLPELPDKKTLERLAQPWQPYRTIASWYLWRCKDTAYTTS